MSTFEPLPQDAPLNPYAAPEVELGGPAIVQRADDVAEAEAIRRAHLNHEATTKGFGALTVFGGICVLLATPVMIYVLSGTEAVGGADQPLRSPLVLGLLAAFFLALGAINIVVGLGMRRLRPWARWAATGLMSINLLSSLIQINPIGILFSAYILYLLVSAKGAMIFSPRYKDVIALTPHIKYRTSRWVKILLVVLLVIIVLMIGLAIIGAVINR